MKSKQEILTALQEGLHTGIITPADIQSLLNTRGEQPAENSAERVAPKPDKLSVVDVMFYIAGIVLFSAIISVIAQSWNDGSPIVHTLLSAGVGAGLWSLAYYLIASPVQSDIRKGLINSLLLTGSLSITAGSYIITTELIGGFNELNLIPGAIMLAVVGAAHIGFDRLVRRDLILLMGVLLCVASFPTLMFGLIKDAGAEIDVGAAILIATAGLLAYSTRVVAKMNTARQKISSSFDGFAAFLALGSMYATSFGNNGILWLALLVAGVFGIFYVSIIAQNKHLLGSASFFLVLALITISFKYFSGYGITTSLILATIGLLASAAIASSINKRYFKVPAAKL
ncbi:MAG TPA: hypothetical protein VLF43_04940 [Candidatus Saccharimonadales bacterium]|nr:hypothetical protein [Candidatus Saccharimonadales bacterium]